MRLIALAKQYSGYYDSQEFHGRLWQRYGYERTLRQNEDTRAVAKYILENPVRAKLAANVLDYPFVGSLVCEVKDLLLSIDDVRLKPDTKYFHGPAKAGHYVLPRSG